VRGLGWIDTYNLPTYEYRCALLRLDTLVKRHSIACIMFIFDILSGRMNSPNFLSALDLNTLQNWNRGSEFLQIVFHRTNYGVHEQMSAAKRDLNEIIGLFDFILTRNQFMNRLKVTLGLNYFKDFTLLKTNTLLTYPTLRLQDKLCTPRAVLCMVPGTCYQRRTGHITRWEKSHGTPLVQ
jgi:hypothetical protein